jgi:hypothetical protein
MLEPHCWVELHSFTGVATSKSRPVSMVVVTLQSSYLPWSTWLSSRHKGLDWRGILGFLRQPWPASEARAARSLVSVVEDHDSSGDYGSYTTHRPKSVFVEEYEATVPFALGNERCQIRVARPLSSLATGCSAYSSLRITWEPVAPSGYPPCCAGCARSHSAAASPFPGAGQQSAVPPSAQREWQCGQLSS